ncbi:MAG: TRAP transporter substrate-binding protein [Alphaproteobacteria bacterium]|jgi:TRAP-type C4-dicarboxylate transport system substrate-binding protein|nr:TRAP transporter substrate-binding protein [Alphaproteobacteria bacterium]
MKLKALIAAPLGLLAALAIGANTANAEIQRTKIKVVGTWHNQSPYMLYEKPFWTKDVTKLSGGKITATLNPITELGLKGWEVMRLTKLGVFDVAHGVYGYVASEEPALEGIDLSSVAKDFKQGRQIVRAYAPIVEKNFKRAFDAQYLFTHPFPSQMIWCNQPINKLSDLKGKKVRVYSTTLGDFVQGLGGTSVTIAFAEVVPALQKGVAECGITGTLPAYQAKWHEVITHAMKIRVGMGLAFAAMSNKKWNTLNADTRAFLKAQSARLEDEMWANSEAEDAVAFACLSGKGKCTKGEPGSVTLVDPAPSDLKERQRILKEFVLKKWAARCSAECVKDWNATVAPIVGIKAIK